jgi:hydroxylamine reductase
MSENKNYSECSINGVCSIDNAISSLHEIVLLHIKNLAFYITKLKDFGITNDLIKKDIIEILYGIFINASYSEKEYNEIIIKIDKYITQSVYLYEKYCKDNNIAIQKPHKKIRRIYKLIDAIKDGEKKTLKKTKTFSIEQKNTYEIVYFLSRSIIIKLTELQRLGLDCKDAYYIVLDIMNSCELNGFCFDNIKEIFNKSIEIYFDLIKLIFATQKKLYGKIQEVDIDTSSYEGKSILVSGSDLKALQSILELSENTGIKVYTHGFDMLVAHTLPELSKYKHLKGHFSVDKNNYIADFSTFRGPILMSRVYMENVDFLYRGRLFSQDPYVSKGIEKIKNDDFTPLIKATSRALGFKKYNKRGLIHAGYDENKITTFTDKILEKVKNDEIKNLYVIGICNCSQNNKYYDELLNNLPKDSYAFSFSYDKQGDNIFHINSQYDGRLFLKIFRNLNEYKDKNISVFMTQGDRYTVSNLLLVCHMGFKHVFSDNFPDNIIAPNTKNILETKFNVNFISDSAIKDIEKTMC